jgi:hypothetical protein
VYMLHDMQSIAIPPVKVAGDHQNFGIAIEAARVAGSGSLYLDCLGLLPLDEGAIHIQMPGGLASNSARVDVAPDGSRSGFLINSGLIIDQVAIDAEVWEMPMNGVLPNLVAFGQSATHSALNDTIAVEMDYCRRFRLLRGAN